MLYDHSFRLNATYSVADSHSHKEEHWVDPSESCRLAQISEFGRDDRRRDLEQLVAMKTTAKVNDAQSVSGLSSLFGKHKLR